MNATIYAFATPDGRSALAVLRASGPNCTEIVQKMIGRSLVARQATLARICDPVSAELLDQAIVLWHPGPSSFTGEDCLEFHVHGSSAVKKALLKSLSRIEGCRFAEPGEFTRRAFQNGKTDLSRLEGVADLLEAETEAQRRQAVAQLDGRASNQCNDWRNQLLDIMALLEASIDFSDEGDAPREVIEEARLGIEKLCSEIKGHLGAISSGEVIRDGFKVVIAGPPNAGKSSLLNLLARRDVAIVTEVAGTTRDVIEVSVDIGGFLVRFFDTAGIRETDDTVELIGIERALLAGKAADLVLWLLPAGSVEMAVPAGLLGAPVIPIYTKSDLCEEFLLRSLSGIKVSAITGRGLEVLFERILEAGRGAWDNSNSVIFVNERQRASLEECMQMLENSLESVSSEFLELTLEWLRAGAQQLGRISGRIGTEDILGAIFSRFCMGK